MEGKLKFKISNENIEVGNVYRAGMAEFAEKFSKCKRILKTDWV